MLLLALHINVQFSFLTLLVSEPTSFYVDLHGSGMLPSLKRILPEMVRLTPRGIREYLGLNRPIYAPSAACGHFGRTPLENGKNRSCW